MFRVTQFNILAVKCSLTKYFPYACKKNQFWDPLTFPDRLNWELRGQLLLKQLEKTKSDIACLCEVDNPDFFILEGFDFHFQSRPGRNEGCLILWRKSRFALIIGSEASLEVQATSRVATSIVLRDLKTDRRIRVVGAHFYWDAASNLQLEESRSIMSFLNTLEPFPTIICADINNTRNSKTFRQITEQGGFKDCFTLAGEISPEFTSVVPDIWRKNGEGALEFQKGRRSEIDFIFLKGPIKSANCRVEVSGSLLTGSQGLVSRSVGEMPSRSDAVPAEEGIPNDFHGSDHLPVVCEVSLV